MNLADFGLSNTAYPLHFYIKDRNGKYLEVNDYYAKNSGFNTVEEMRGLSDLDLQFLPTDQALSWRNNDRQVMYQKKLQLFDEDVTLFDGSQVSVLSHKMPLYSNTKKIVGSAGVSIIADKAQDYSSVIFNKQSELTCVRSSDNSNLTPREIECLFHSIKGETAKIIANNLSISQRTVEHHLMNCKIKLNCFRRHELITNALKITAIKKLLKEELT